MEDITDPESLRLNAKANRTVSFYGWMRGVPLKNKGTVHIPGKNLIGQYHKYIIIVIICLWEIHIHRKLSHGARYIICKCFISRKSTPVVNGGPQQNIIL